MITMKLYSVWSSDHPNKVQHYLTPQQVDVFKALGYWVIEYEWTVEQEAILSESRDEAFTREINKP
jgi:hypothetical protein